jgi:hypothetical protein
MAKRASIDSLRKQALLDLAKSMKSVSKACEILGFSRDTYYRLLKTARGEGVSRSIAKPSRQSSPETLRKRQEIESLVLGILDQNSGLGKRRIARLIQGMGIYISPSGVYNILKKNPQSDRASRDGVRDEKNRLVSGDPAAGQPDGIPAPIRGTGLSDGKINRNLGIRFG